MTRWPTNKWWAATVTAAGTVVLLFWSGGGVDTEDKKIVLVGLVVQRLIAYITPNESAARTTARGTGKATGHVPPSS